MSPSSETSWTGTFDTSAAVSSVSARTFSCSPDTFVAISAITWSAACLMKERIGNFSDMSFDQSVLLVATNYRN